MRGATGLRRGDMIGEVLTNAALMLPSSARSSRR